MKTPFFSKQKNALGNIIQLNNIELYYEEYGSGKPLVLLHGFGGCVQNWHPFTEQLANHYRLILIDLRGHGHSTNPENRFTHKKSANDVFALLDYLRIDLFSAMGMSTGGMVLMHMATSQPGRIDSMVLISATTHFPEQARAIMRRASFNTMPFPVKEMYQECAKRGEVQVRQLIAQFNALHENYDDMNFSAEDLSVISARTLIIHGENDNFFPCEIAQNMTRFIPNSSLWLIRGGDHVPVFNLEIPFVSTAINFLNAAKN